MTQREREREMSVVMGRGLFGELLRLTIFFSPQILLPPQHSLSPLSCTPPPLFFIPPFVCTVGWILSTPLSTSHLSAPSHFFSPSPLKSGHLFPISSLYPALHCSAFFPFYHSASQKPSENDTDTALWLRGGEGARTGFKVGQMSLTSMRMGRNWERGKWGRLEKR